MATGAPHSVHLPAPCLHSPLTFRKVLAFRQSSRLQHQSADVVATHLLNDYIQSLASHILSIHFDDSVASLDCITFTLPE